MRKAIATVSVGGSLPVKLEAIAAAQFDAVELFDADLTCSTLSAEDVASRCRDLGLGIDLFQPLRDVVGMRPDVFPDRVRFAQAKLELMERLGATRLLACSAVHPDAVDDADLLAEQLAHFGDRAAEHGVTVAFEALAWGTHVNRVGQTWEAVRAAGRDNVGIAVDTFHMLARGDGPKALAHVPGDRIAFLQIADAPHLAMDVLEWSRHHRCFPGQGTLDVTGLVAAVLEAGYRGPLSLEVFSDIVREADPRDTARDAMRSLLHLEEQLRGHWDERPARRPQVELVDPPSAPRALSAAFVEIAVDPAASELPDLLRGLGFRPDETTPPACPVSTWRHGGAVLLLDSASDLEGRPDAAAARPAVTAIGMAVDDPARLAARADALGWPRADIRGHRGAAEPLTTTPVGVRVAVTGPSGLAGPADTAAGASGWGGIDHVGVAVDVDRSDAEVSFYRTLFGLRPGPVSEFFDPSGRLRSRVMAPVGGGLGLVHNIVVRAGRQSTPGVNQVAFHCTSLLDRVEQLRDAAVPLLPVPDAYYDDLEARLDPDPVLLTRLRTLGVLYDREGDGELLHVYTPLVGGRFYLELLERRGGYAGFGAANTAVRLAMQATTPWIG